MTKAEQIINVTNIGQTAPKQLRQLKDMLRVAMKAIDDARRLLSDGGVWIRETDSVLERAEVEIERIASK